MINKRNMHEEVKNVKISVPTEHNSLVKQALEAINNSEEIKTLWLVSNTNAVDRLKMTDHGPIHFQIVANIALRLTRILKKSGVDLSVEGDFGLTYEHGELVIFLASLFHDLGITISREGHEEFSLAIADRVMHNILDFLPEIERTIIISDTLHAIISHRKGGTPYTIEAGIVRVADALDMNEGRSKVSFEGGIIDIHSLSEAAIENVEIKTGDVKPIQVNVTMNNSVGIFQIDELLKKKLKGSGLEKYISVKALIHTEQEKSLVKEFSIA